jgi:hypothetical protein
LAGTGDYERLIAAPDRQNLVTFPQEAELDQFLDIFFIIDY